MSRFKRVFANQKKFDEIIECFQQKESSKDVHVDKCNIYVIKGVEHTIMIDTGSGANESDPRVLYNGLISHVFLTHWHWDHSGGAHFFDNDVVYIDTQDREALIREIIDDETLSRYFLDDRYHFKAPTKIRSIDYNTSLDLGNGATLQWYWTPGHTIGSCVFLYKNSNDESLNCLFTGDTIYGQEISPFFNESSRDLWITSLDQIESICTENNVSTIFGGHYAPLRGMSAIRSQIQKQKTTLSSKRTKKMGVCINCFRGLLVEDIKICSGCMWSTYCSKSCAEIDWVRNDKKCPNVNFKI